MDTLINTTGQKNTNLRIAAIFAGVLIAFICAFVALKTANAGKSDMTQTSFQTPAFVNLSALKNVASLAGHSVMTFTAE